MGILLEFYYKMDWLELIYQKYVFYCGVKLFWIDYFNCFSYDVDVLVVFYFEFGFCVIEYIEDEESKKFWVVWMYCKGGVYDMVFINGIGLWMYYVVFWVLMLLNIIDLFDLMLIIGYVLNIECGLGWYGILNVFFLYILDFDGYWIEIYCFDYQMVDFDLELIKWDFKDLQCQIFWGVVVLESWFKYGIVFVGVDQKDLVLNVMLIIVL